MIWHKKLHRDNRRLFFLKNQLKHLLNSETSTWSEIEKTEAEIFDIENKIRQRQTKNDTYNGL